MQLDKRTAYRMKIFELAATSDVTVPSYFCLCPLFLI